MAERGLAALPLPQLRARLGEARYRRPGGDGEPWDCGALLGAAGAGPGRARVGRAGRVSPGRPRTGHHPQRPRWPGWAAGAAWLPAAGLSCPRPPGGRGIPGSAGCLGSGKERVWRSPCVLAGVTDPRPRHPARVGRCCPAIARVGSAALWHGSELSQGLSLTRFSSQPRQHAAPNRGGNV